MRDKEMTLINMPQIIVLYSPNLGRIKRIKKPWTRLEKKSAQSRAFEDENEYILPLRIDDSKVPGILATTGYLDYRKEPMEEIVNLLVEKINNYGG